jgi:hypothetical protein
MWICGDTGCGLGEAGGEGGGEGDEVQGKIR